MQEEAKERERVSATVRGRFVESRGVAIHLLSMRIVTWNARGLKGSTKRKGGGS